MGELYKESRRIKYVKNILIGVKIPWFSHVYTTKTYCGYSMRSFFYSVYNATMDAPFNEEIK
jgi:hypothetical protein